MRVIGIIIARVRALFSRFINAMIALLAAIRTANEDAVFQTDALVPLFF